MVFLKKFLKLARESENESFIVARVLRTLQRFESLDDEMLRDLKISERLRDLARFVFFGLEANFANETNATHSVGHPLKRENVFSGLVDKELLMRNLLKEANGNVLYVCGQLLSDFELMGNEAVVNLVATCMLERYTLEWLNFTKMRLIVCVLF